MPHLVTIHDTIPGVTGKGYRSVTPPMRRIAVFRPRLTTGAMATGNDLRWSQLHWDIHNVIVAIDCIDYGRIFYIVADIRRTLQVNFIGMES